MKTTLGLKAADCQVTIVRVKTICLGQLWIVERDIGTPYLAVRDEPLKRVSEHDYQVEL
ncbi:MAG: hypothetical protein ACREGR_03615 [Minisyncoccia bacterium]